MALLENVWLDSCLAPLASWLAREDVTDIWVNRPQEVWIETLGGRIERHEAKGLTREIMLRLARQIAATTAQGVSRAQPLLAAALPDGSRAQVVLPPATRGEVALAIRRHVVSDLPLEAWRDSLGVGCPLPSTEADSAEGDLIDVLRRAVRERKNILVSGGTSTGKTTLVNALLQEIPSDERLILIEDTPELQLRHANAVGLIAARGETGEAAVTPEDLLIASLRMRPDRIILGEIRGSEALTYLRAINTGHPGSITTIHADTPERAIDQLALLVLQAGSRLAWDDVVRYAARSIDLVVQMGRTAGGRGIVAVERLGT